MKKEYMKPAMSVVVLRQRSQILAGSNGDDYLRGDVLGGGGSDEEYYTEPGDIR